MIDDLPIDLHLIRVFLTVYETRSVSRAAEQLGIRQPAASMALKKMRAALRDPLFVHTPKGMQPTAMAHRLAPPLKSSLIDISRCLQSGSFNPTTSRDVLRFSAGDILETPMALRISRIIEREAPGARSQSITLPAHELEQALSDGVIDFAIGHFPELKSANIMTSSVSKFTYACFARAHHPLQNTRLNLHDLEEVGQVSLQPGCALMSDLENWFSGQGVKRNVILRTSHFCSLPPLLAQTDLIAVLPTNFKGAWFYGGEAHRLPASFEMPTGELQLYWHRCVHSDPRHTWWRAILVRELRQGATRSMNFRDGDDPGLL